MDLEARGDLWQPVGGRPQQGEHDSDGKVSCKLSEIKRPCGGPMLENSRYSLPHDRSQIFHIDGRECGLNAASQPRVAFAGTDEHLIDRKAPPAGSFRPHDGDDFFTWHLELSVQSQNVLDGTISRDDEP